MSDTRETLITETIDALGLVMANPPTEAELRQRTNQELIEAENWAALVHFSASDNPVPVPPRPSWLEAAPA